MDLIWLIPILPGLGAAINNGNANNPNQMAVNSIAARTF